MTVSPAATAVVVSARSCARCTRAVRRAASSRAARTPGSSLPSASSSACPGTLVAVSCTPSNQRVYSRTAAAPRRRTASHTGRTCSAAAATSRDGPGQYALQAGPGQRLRPLAPQVDAAKHWLSLSGPSRNVVGSSRIADSRGQRRVVAGAAAGHMAGWGPSVRSMWGELPVIMQPGLDSQPDLAFTVLAGDYLDDRAERHPQLATELGDHRHDARLPDFSAAASAGERRALDGFAARLAAIDVAALSAEHQVDARMLANSVALRIFELDELRERTWNPLAANPGRAIHALLQRDFAALPERLGLGGRPLPLLVSELLATARGLPGPMLGSTWETAIGQFSARSTWSAPR